MFVVFSSIAGLLPLVGFLRFYFIRRNPAPRY
jgi:hypothetical protein